MATRSSVAVVLRDVLQHHQPVAVGQAHVGEAEVEARLAQPFPRLGEAAHGDDPEAHFRQRQLE